MQASKLNNGSRLLSVSMDAITDFDEWTKKLRASSSKPVDTLQNVVVHVSGNGSGENLKLVFRTLAGLPKVTSFQVRCSSSLLPLDAMTEALRFGSKLTSFSLSCYSLRFQDDFNDTNDNKSDKLEQFCRELRNHYSLEEFQISCGNPAGRQGIKIVDFILESLKCVRKIRKVVMFVKHVVGQGNASAYPQRNANDNENNSNIAMNDNVEEDNSSNLSSTALTNSSLAEMIRLPTLRILKFGGFKFTEKQLKDLAQELSRITNGNNATNSAKAMSNTRHDGFEEKGSHDESEEQQQQQQEGSALRELSFWRCQIGDDDAVILSQMLKTNRTLEKLDLSWNTFGCKGTVALADAVINNENLRGLFLHQVSSIGPEGYKALAKMLESNFVLRDLWIKRNSGEDYLKIEWFLKMNRGDKRQIIRRTDATKEEWVDVIQSNSDDLREIYYFLSNNPPMCERSRAA